MGCRNLTDAAFPPRRVHPIYFDSLDYCSVALDVGAIGRCDVRPDDGTPRHRPIIRRTPLPASDFVTGDTSGQTQAVQVVFTILADPPVFGGRDHNGCNR